MTPLLRCLGNLCSGQDEYIVQACDNPRLLHTLGTFLDSTVRHIVKECLWVLSNMAGKIFPNEFYFFFFFFNQKDGYFTTGFHLVHQTPLRGIYSGEQVYVPENSKLFSFRVDSYSGRGKR